MDSKYSFSKKAQLVVEGNAPSIINTPDQHGFVMAGFQALYLCHLPMFSMQNHMYQAIFKASIPEPAMQEYVSDRQQHSNEAYILGNVATDLMTIPQLVTGTTVSFIADIFRGLPGDPNKDIPLIHNVRVDIQRTVYFRHFDYSMDHPRYLTYVLFGTGNEAHMTHFLTKEPDFDHVMDLAEVPDWLPPQQLESGVHVNIVSLLGIVPYCSNPLTDPIYQVQYEGQESFYTIKTGTSYWFDPTSLNSKDPCS